MAAKLKLVQGASWREACSLAIFKLFRSLQLQFSGPTGINFRYSYSFVGLTGIFLYSYSSVQLHEKMVRGIIFRKLQLHYIK